MWKYVITAEPGPQSWSSRQRVLTMTPLRVLQDGQEVWEDDETVRKRAELVASTMKDGGFRVVGQERFPFNPEGDNVES